MVGLVSHAASMTHCSVCDAMCILRDTLNSIHLHSAGCSVNACKCNVRRVRTHGLRVGPHEVTKKTTVHTEASFVCDSNTRLKTSRSYACHMQRSKSQQHVYLVLSLAPHSSCHQLKEWQRREFLHKALTKCCHLWNSEKIRSPTCSTTAVVSAGRKTDGSRSEEGGIPISSTSTISASACGQTPARW